MDKQQAIVWFREIQSGAGVDRTTFPDEFKGSIPWRHWDDPLFTLGVEYGVLIALMRAFDITPEDVRRLV